MKQNGACASVFLGIACLNLVGASQVLNLRINPELEPKSDARFFGKDYPDDVRGPEYHHFGHPYPTVQDSDRYDKDYVKDENDDGGYWKAQMEYDRLKNKLAKEKKEMERALAKENEEKKELDKAKAIEDAAEKDRQAAEQKEEDSEKDRKKADAAHDVIKDHLDESTEKTETEVKDLEDCKRQLAEAKAKLKALLAEKEAAEKKLAEKDKEEAAAESTEKALEKAAAQLLEDYNKLKAQLGKNNVDKEMRDVKEAEDELAKAAAKLRQFRHADPDGGVYEVKSSASCASLLATLLLLGGGGLL